MEAASSEVSAVATARVVRMPSLTVTPTSGLAPRSSHAPAASAKVLSGRSTKAADARARCSSSGRFSSSHGSTSAPKTPCSSRGGPGSTMTSAPRGCPHRNPGAVPKAFGTRVAPSGMRACRRLFWSISRPARVNHASISSTASGHSSRGAPTEPATP